MGVNPVEKSGVFKGWQFITTGGNCTALYKSDARGYWLITDEEGIAAPNGRMRIVYLGRYNHDSDLVQEWQTTPKCAIATVEEWRD